MLLNTRCRASASRPFKGPSCLGFTLVEVLVVAVIMGLLAAVAIPMYSGYAKSQKRQAAVAVAQTAAVTASSIQRRTGTVPDSTTLNGNLSLPNINQFGITVIPGTPNRVRVIERSNPNDTAWGFANF